MEIDVKQSKQRNKRRERAQRMQAERDKDADGVGIVDGDSADEDSKKPIRPPQRRKKANIFKEPSPILEEDVVDGFAILSFKSYEDLEYAIKLANKRNEKRLSAITELTTIMLEDKLPKIDTGQIKDEHGDGRDREREWNYKNNNHHITHTTNNIAFNHDPGTSDDSGRASERLTTSSVAQRDQDSSRDRLSDASSRCSSGKGYICDSEGDDDKASDGGSTTASTTTSAAVVPRKPVDSFQTTGVPLSNGPLGLGGSLSPVPCQPSNSGPAPNPSPAPAALPPPSLPFATTPLQVNNEPLNTHLTSLPNHVGSIQNNGQQTSTTTATIPNGKVPASSTVNNNNNKLPTTCTTTSLSSPNSKQTMVSSPSAGSSPGGQMTTTTTVTSNNNNNSNSSNNSSKKHSPTISNLLAPTTSTVTTTSNVQLQQQQAPITTSVMAIPSPVSSTSSLSSISIPSRLGSSTPPVTPASIVNANSINTPTSTAQTPPTSMQPQQQQQIQQQTPQIQSTQHQQSQPQQPQPPSIQSQSMPQHPTIDQMTNQQLQSMSNASLLPTSLGMPPTLNGPGIPTMMGLGGLGPLGHLAAPPYRALYPYGLYSPYGMAPHPYGAMPPTPIAPPALSPRSSENRRDSSPLVLSKPIKSVTPNSNSQPTNNLQSSSNSTTPAGPNYISSSSAATNSPRSYSPSSRERDNFSVSSLSSKSTTVTPSSSVISYNNTGPSGQPTSANMPPIMGNSASLLSPYGLSGQSPVITSSAASSLYTGSSLSYPTKIPGFPPPSSWPPPLSSASNMSSPIMTTMAGPGLSGRPTPITPTSVAQQQQQQQPSFGPSPSFAAPLPPPSAVPTSVASVNSHPFSAESLLTNKPDQADLLRRELDNRFLDRSGLNQPPSVSIPTSSMSQSPVSSAIASIPTSSSSRPSAQATPPGSANNSNPGSNSGSVPTTPTAQQSASNIPFLRQELHHHQHQHTHLHQHQHQHQALLPGAPSASIFPPPLFKDIPKIGAGDSPFYRTAPLMGMPPYPYPSGILHPGLSGPTQFVPPSHLQSFVPKQQGPPAVVDPTKPKQVKTGRWNAMHVRIAWEIYHHQAKQNPEKASSAAGVKPEQMLRPMYPPPSSPSVRQHEMTQPPSFPQTAPPSMQGRPFDPMTANFLSSPSGLGVSPFGRYGSPFASPFGGLSPYAREMQLGGPLDPWRNSALSRNMGNMGNMGYPPPPQALTAAWPMKPDPGLDAARREAEERERQMREREERDRQRREREEKERKEREREEKLRKEQQEREQRERERERKEKERREMERREMERERMLQQQRLNDSAKLVRDRSPLRNGDSDIRIKEEPRKDEAEMLMRTDPRYQMAAWQMASRNPTHMLPPPHLTRGGMIGPPGSFVGLPSHYPPTPGWPPGLDPYRDPYRLMDPMLRSYPMNPMLDAMRAEEAKAYAQATALYRGKDPSPVPQQGHPPTVPSPHHRLPPNGPMKPPSVGPLPITANDMHKKEDAPR
ncbi:hypothetical protein ACKWTF_005815 [Chironomus riparius]